MYRPHFDQFTKPGGTVQRIGWIVVDEAGKPYVNEKGAIPASFEREDAQDLADELNRAAIR